MFEREYCEECMAQYKIKDAGLRLNSEIYNLYKDLNIMDVLQWLGRVMRMEDGGNSKRVS
jgi:hypothetical protein